MRLDGAGCLVSEESTDKAVAALAQLWGSGNFDCGPQDWDWMVEQCVEEFAASRRNHAAKV